MSLPKRLYELGRAVANSHLVISKVASYENMLAFQELLNQAYPTNEKEAAQRELIRSMYYCHTKGFLQYISTPHHRVRSLILWTESKSIARFFGLNRCVHISWNEETNKYTVSQYVPRDDPPTEQVVTAIYQKKDLNPNAPVYNKSYAAAASGAANTNWADQE